MITQMTTAKSAVRRDPILRRVKTLEHPFQADGDNILFVGATQAGVQLKVFHHIKAQARGQCGLLVFHSKFFNVDSDVTVGAFPSHTPRPNPLRTRGIKGSNIGMQAAQCCTVA